MKKITKHALVDCFLRKKSRKQLVTSEKTKAAVLVPIINYPHGLHVLLTQRAELITEYAGQISFPGGRMEANDISLEVTALRETAEEIGLHEQQIKIIGELPAYETISGRGFLVTPFVGLVTPPITLTLDTREVAAVFEVPLEFLLDKNNQRRKHRIWQDKRHYFYVIEYNSYFIWGLTAKIIVSLGKLFK